MAKQAKQSDPQEGVAAYNWESHEGPSGLENLGQQDLGIPILTIVQKGSAEYDADHVDHASKAIPGVKVGDIINTVTREILYSEGKDPVRVTPYFYKLVYLEWRPKTAGGGIVATHVNPNILNSAKRDEKTGKDVLPNGNNVVTTAYFFVRLLQGDESIGDALMTLTSTQLKKSRVWLNMMKTFTGPNGNTLPMYSRAYYLSTIPESNSKGTWRGWKIEAAPKPHSEASLITSLVNAVRDTNENSNLLIGNQSNHIEEDIL